MGGEWAQQRREFDRSYQGLPCRRYRDMVARVKGAPQYNDRWKGLDIVTKDVFLDWTFKDYDYLILWTDWRDSNFNKLLSPSIHRIDNNKGYVIGNMKWLTRSEHAKTSRKRNG